MTQDAWIGRRHPVAQKIRELIEPVVRRRALELVDIQYIEHGSSATLRVFADAPGGIGINQLEGLSQTISDLLDAEDPVARRYNLEVSSPGVDRPLTRMAHFEAAHGEEVLITSVTKVDGSRKHRGILSGAGDGKIILQVDGKSRTIPVELVDHAHTIYTFEAAPKPGKKHAPPGAPPRAGGQNSPNPTHRPNPGDRRDAEHTEE